MNIAVFGGSFDPPHLGHEAIVNKAIKTLDIEKLIIVPTYLNPFKTISCFDENIRFKLVTNLFSNNPNIQISNYEIEQRRATPTIQTIKHLISQNQNIVKIYLIIGADNLYNLHLWKDYKELKKLVTFVVVTRDGIKIDNFQTLNIDFDISSTKIRENLDITVIPDKIKQEVSELWKID